MRSPVKLLLAISAILTFVSCSTRENPPSGRDGWLKGSPHEKLDVVAKQLRGWDMTMVETGYRYQELYWAGKDGNWEYASYQAEKIRQTMEYGLDRRPKRAASAEAFLKALSDMDSVTKHGDSTAFVPTFQMLTGKCNACHRDEKVRFFNVDLPLVRQSPIRGAPRPKP